MVTQNEVSLSAKTNVSYRYFFKFFDGEALMLLHLTFGGCEASAIMG